MDEKYHCSIERVVQKPKHIQKFRGNFHTPANQSQSKKLGTKRGCRANKNM